MGDEMNVNENDNENEPKDTEDEFNDEFDFGEEHEDALTTDEHEEHLESDTEEPVVSEPPKRKSFLIPAIIGIAVVGFIGWKIFDAFKKPEEVVVETPMPKEEPLPPPKQIAAPEMPSTAPRAPGVTLEETKREELSDTIQKRFAEQEKMVQDRIAKLEQQLTTAASAMQSNQQTITNLQAQISTLSTTITQLNDEIKAIRQEQLAYLAKLEEKKHVVVKPKPKPKPQVASPRLVVHAIIPGRAWLRTIDGKTITVAEGDNVGEYGKVLKIDAPNGVVITTSGVTLR